MKRLFFIPAVMFLVFSQTLFTSCQKSTEDIIIVNGLIGMWRVHGSEIDTTVEGEELVDYLVNNFGYTEEKAQDFSDDFITENYHLEVASVSFKADKTYLLELINQDEEDGTWLVSADGKLLSLIESGDTTQFEILDITANSLSIQLPTEQNTVDADGDGEDETTVDVNIIQSLGKFSNGGMGG